jgi:hypothetical protein
MVRLRIPDADREIWSWRPSSRTNGVEIKQPCMSADARSHEHRRDHIRGTKNSRRVDRCWGAGEVRLRKGYSDVIADLIRIPTGPCGFGRAPPDPRWPGNARVAVQLVANFKEGAENSSSHGPRACALPALYPFASYAKEGGLISYGVDPVNQFQQGAGYVDRILHGANPADLPVVKRTSRKGQREMSGRLKARRYGRVAAVWREIATSGSGGTTMGNSAG